MYSLAWTPSQGLSEQEYQYHRNIIKFIINDGTNSTDIGWLMEGTAFKCKLYVSGDQTNEYKPCSVCWSICCQSCERLDVNFFVICCYDLLYLSDFWSALSGLGNQQLQTQQLLVREKAFANHWSFMACLWNTLHADQPMRIILFHLVG